MDKEVLKAQTTHQADIMVIQILGENQLGNLNRNKGEGILEDFKKQE